MNYSNEKIKPIPRKYFSEELDFNKWEVIEKELKIVIDEEIKSAEELITFIEKTGEFETIISDIEAWKYIRMTQYADDEKYEKDFNKFFAEIVEKFKPYKFKIQKKIYESDFKKELDKERYSHYLKILANEIEMFKEENIVLFTKEQELANKYGGMYGKLTVNYKGEEKTLIQLSVHLKDPDRAVREEVWRLIADRINKEKDSFNKLFDELKEVRIKLAKNCGFDNYRDYKHQEMGRFAYTPQDLVEFHNSVEKVVIPFVKELSEERKEKLNLEILKPWDMSVDLDGKVLKPFKTVEEFIEKGAKILYSVKPDYGTRFNMMYNTELLDLENRKGKAPGGYNYPLEGMGSSFIFMNSVGLHGDIVTLLHEAGHAMHAKALVNEPIKDYRDCPSEAAELASMAMEFLTMDYWGEYYSDNEDFKKAKRKQLEGALSFLPWCMTVDALQQWIYTNPNHSVDERDAYFGSLLDRFSSGSDYAGFEDYKVNGWLRQLHIFEVPFYYIEYGISQLGALSVYKNYKENPDKAVEDYEKFLKIGYSKPLDVVFEEAGIKFDFSEEYIKELVDFVRKELKQLG